LGAVIKNPTLTVMDWSEKRGPRLTASTNSCQHCAVCSHRMDLQYSNQMYMTY
jgi:hypothetical protein